MPATPRLTSHEQPSRGTIVPAWCADLRRRQAARPSAGHTQARRHATAARLLLRITLLLTIACGATVWAATPRALAGDGPVALDPAAAFASITEADLLVDLKLLTSGQAEGRDSPSLGLTLAAQGIAERLKAAGLRGAGKDGSFFIPFARRLPAPVPDECALSVAGLGESRNGKAGGGSAGDGKAGAPKPGAAEPAEHTFTYGKDFVPVWQTGGRASGEACFVGFGIDSHEDKYDDIRGDLRGKIAVIIEAEPHHKRLFQGPEVSPAADLYGKLKHLAEAGVAGVLVVRRPAGEQDAAPAELAFRHTWASWVGQVPHQDLPTPVGFPVLEITPAVALTIMGQDVLPLAGKIEASGKPPTKPVASGHVVTMAASCVLREVSMDNVVALLPGSDPVLAGEHVVLGAHYDHLGVDPRGRVGIGADDNASGTAALLEVATALALTPPRRSVLVCAFAAEEDGLVGSQALCENLPVPKASLVAMLNMDMIGRGPADTVYVLGLLENPSLEKLLGRAQKLQPTKLKKVVLRQGQELFQRSDHYSFHRLGVPSLFFFENLPIEANPDYHTWRDTLDKLDLDKVARTARLVFNTAWLLANDDERPPPPGK